MHTAQNSLDLMTEEIKSISVMGLEWVFSFFTLQPESQILKIIELEATHFLHEIPLGLPPPRTFVKFCPEGIIADPLAPI